MAQHEEIELKWALAGPDHDRLEVLLAGLLGNGLHLDQENRFFDSADLRLRRAGMTLRLRRENGRIIATVKRRRPVQADGAFRHDEWEEEVDPALWTIPDDRLAALVPLPAEVRTVLGPLPLNGFGGFANRRRSWQDGPHLLCLDRTAFPGGAVEHELEIETADPVAARDGWSRRLMDWGIAWTPQPLTKFARFLRHAAG